MPSLCPPQQRIRLSGLRICLRAVGKGEHVHRIKEIEKLIGVTRGLAEAVIEGASTGPAHFIDHAVENLPALFIFIESLIQKVAEKTTALRYAPAVCEADAGQRISSVGMF